MKVIKTNKIKKVKWKYELKNKLIIYRYYLKLFLTLNYDNKLIYEIYLIYFMI